MMHIVRELNQLVENGFAVVFLSTIGIQQGI